MKRNVLIISALAVVVVAAVSIVISMNRSDPQFREVATSERADYEYMIPVGTGNRIDAGEEISIIPAELEVHVGESIRIINNDDRGHVVGVFFVGPGETMSQEFTSPGTLTGGCTIHPSGEFTLQVLE